MKLILNIMILIFISGTNAAEICDDMASFSCMDGSFRDPTGTVRSASEVSDEANAFMGRVRESLNDEVSRTLQQPDSEAFRTNSMSLLGLNNSPACARASATSPLPQACQTQLREGLVNLVARQTVSANRLPTPGLHIVNPTDLRLLQNDRHFTDLITFVQQKADRELVDYPVLERVRDTLFPQVKRLVVARISELNIPEEQKRYMMAKVNAIEFSGFDCAKAGQGQKIDHLLRPNAAYNHNSNTFKFCNGYALRSNSDFSMVTTIAHELTHSIDPCNISRGSTSSGFRYTSTNLAAMENEYPLSNVLSCLRSPSSVQALNFTRLGFVPEGAETPGTPNFCDHDQIGESVSDWMAAEVLPRYISANYNLSAEEYRMGYANARRMACSGKTSTAVEAGEEHPRAEDRINKILLTNPNIRRQMGCTTPSRSSYCDSEREYSAQRTPDSSRPSTPSPAPGPVPAQPSPTGTVR